MATDKQPIGPEPGSESWTTTVLETASGLMQSIHPIKSIHEHICGVHKYAKDPSRQVIAHHFCSHLGEEMRQCVIYDSNDKHARLIGVEYVISRRLFESLPRDERKYWHSHVNEVMGGIISAPGVVPMKMEDQVMTSLIDTYGKTIHMWQVDRGDVMPLGEPQVMMSLLPHDKIDPKLEEKLEKEWGTTQERISAHRRSVFTDPPTPHPDADHDWLTDMSAAGGVPVTEETFPPLKASDVVVGGVGGGMGGVYEGGAEKMDMREMAAELAHGGLEGGLNVKGEGVTGGSEGVNVGPGA